MAHEKTNTDVIATLEGTPRAWHKLDTRFQGGMNWAALWALIGLAGDTLSEILLADALKPEYANLLRAKEHKLIVSSSRNQIMDVVSKNWNPVGHDAWMGHVEDVVKHLQDITGSPCEVVSIGTVDAGRKLFVTVRLPLGFGQGDRKTEVYLSFLGSAKEGFGTVACVDGTVVVCGNTYGFVDQSGSPIKWSLSHRKQFGAEHTQQVKDMLSDAQSGVNRRIVADDIISAVSMDRAEQQALLALIMAKTEVQQPNIARYIYDAGVPSLDQVLSASTSERKLVSAVELLAKKIPQDLGPDSRVYRDAAEMLVSQPGTWGDTAKNVESAITYHQRMRGHESNTTARANNFYWGTTRQSAQTALEMCVQYSEQKQASDSILSAIVSATPDTSSPAKKGKAKKASA